MSSHRLIVLIVLLTLCAPGAARTDVAPGFEEASADGQATVRVLWTPSPGWAEADEGRQPDGVTVALMQRFADWLEDRHDIDLALEFVREPDWSAMYARVRDGQGGVFGLGNVTITESRARELAFSPPYIHNVAVLISHRDRPEVATPDALREAFDGLEALAFRDTLHAERLEALRADHWPGMPIRSVESNDAILEGVGADAGFAFIDAYNYYRARAAGAALRHHRAFNDPGEAFGVIMPHGSDWAGVVAEFFADHEGLIDAPWYRELLEAHLGARVAEILISN